MEHDLLAELQAYRNELARPHDETHEAEVLAEIDRVKAAIGRRAEVLAAEADGHDAADRYQRAGESRKRAREYTQALADMEDTSAQEPTERAVPRRRPKTSTGTGEQGGSE